MSMSAMQLREAAEDEDEFFGRAYSLVAVILERMAEAIAAGNAQAYAALFTHDCDLVTSPGATVCGREEVEALHEAAFSAARCRVEYQRIERAKFVGSLATPRV